MRWSDAERRGLIRVVAEQHTPRGRGSSIRCSGRSSGAGWGWRRRGGCAVSWCGHCGNSRFGAPEQRIRLAELTLDSDEQPQTDLLVAAAQDAIALTNITLGERLARAAVNRAAGWWPANCWPERSCGRATPPKPNRRSVPSTPTSMNELELLRWGAARIANLHWSMGDAEGADEVLDLLREQGHPPRCPVVRRWAGASAIDDCSEGQLEEAVSIVRAGAGGPGRVRARHRVGGVRRHTRAGADGSRRRGRGGRRRGTPGRRPGRRPAAASGGVRRDLGRWCSPAISTPPSNAPPTSCGSLRPASIWPGGWAMCWPARWKWRVAASPTRCRAWNKPSRATSSPRRRGASRRGCCWPNPIARWAE